MDKTKTVKNLAEFYNKMYQIAINDMSVPQELQMELDFGAYDYALNENLDSWIKTLNFLDNSRASSILLQKINPFTLSPEYPK